MMGRKKGTGPFFREYQVRREILVALQETDEIDKKFLVHQGVRRDVAEEIDVLVPAVDLAHELNATEQ